MRNLRELPLSLDLGSLLTGEGLSPLGQARLLDPSVHPHVLVTSVGSRCELEDELSLPADHSALLRGRLLSGKEGEAVLLRFVSHSDRGLVLQSLLPSSRHENLLQPMEAFELVLAEEKEEDARPLCLVFPASAHTLSEHLSSLSAQGESLSPTHAQRILTQLADVLLHCQRHGIAHDDLCPQNILVDVREDGSPHVYLTDFGTALLLRRHGETAVLPNPVYSHSLGLGFIAPLVSDRGVPVALDPVFGFLNFDETPFMSDEWRQLGIPVDDLLLGDYNAVVPTA